MSSPFGQRITGRASTPWRNACPLTGTAASSIARDAITMV